MVEDPNAAAESLQQASENLNAVSNKLDAVTTKMSDLFARLGKEGGQKLEDLGLGAAQIDKGFRQVNTSIQGTRDGLRGIDTSSISKGFSSLLEAGERAFANITKSAGGSADSISKDLGKAGEALSSLAVVGAAGVKMKAWDMPVLKQISEVQAMLMDTQKVALQTGIAFGDSFEKANANVNSFARSMEDSIMTTMESKDEILNVRKALGEAFGATGPITSITNLAKSTNQLHGALNLTNVAILTGKAVGMEHSEMANILNQTHLELGEGIDGAAVALGRIGQAAEKSGLGYRKVSDSITKAASDLKLFGGTIGSVAPLFEAFSNSLQSRGLGRQGLTPELFQSFVGGLKGMQFETRALMGLQVGAGGAGGAIGAGLEMEAALEGGEGGMEKVVDSLTETLERFGGGRIVTRAEAIEDPAAQRNFMVQRQLLQNMMGLDTATATKTLDMLQDIQSTGLKTGKDAEGKLAELIGSGQAVAKETTTDQVRATLAVQDAVLKSGREIATLLKERGAGTGLAKIFQNLDTAIENMATRGKVDLPRVIKDLKRGLSGEEIKMAPKALQGFFGKDSFEGLARMLGAQFKENALPARTTTGSRMPAAPPEPVKKTELTPMAPGEGEAALAEREKEGAFDSLLSSLQSPFKTEISRPELSQMSRVAEAPVIEMEAMELPANVFDNTDQTRASMAVEAAVLRSGKDITAAIEESIKTKMGVPATTPAALARSIVDTKPQPKTSMLTTQEEAEKQMAMVRQPRLEPQTAIAAKTTEIVRQEAVDRGTPTTTAARPVAVAAATPPPARPVEREYVIKVKVDKNTIVLDDSMLKEITIGTER